MSTPLTTRGAQALFVVDSVKLLVTAFILSFILYYRVVEVVDSVKARLTDPCITCHWSSVGFDTTTLATIHITSPEVGHLARWEVSWDHIS